MASPIPREALVELLRHNAQASWEALEDVSRTFCVAARMEPFALQDTETRLANFHGPPVASTRDPEARSRR